MSEQTFLLVVFAMGAFLGVSQLAISSFLFATAGRIIRSRAMDASPSGISQLIGYTLATIFSGGYLVLVVMIAVQLTNEFPQWAYGKRLFWIGALVGTIAFRVFGGRLRKNL